MTVIEASELDVLHLRLIRESVRTLMRQGAASHPGGPARLLDIAPQEHEGARPFFPTEVVIDTFDLDPTSGSTYIGDICTRNEVIADATYDYVVCTEVLEHTLRPFDAIVEIRRMLRPGGRLFLSVPLNFRIHGPLPDCWRFTEHGLRALLSTYAIESIESVETEGRPLMPIHYRVVAARPKAP